MEYFHNIMVLEVIFVWYLIYGNYNLKFCILFKVKTNPFSNYHILLIGSSFPLSISQFFSLIKYFWHEYNHLL